MKKTRRICCVILSILFILIACDNITELFMQTAYAETVYTTSQIQTICNNYGFKSGAYWSYNSSTGDSTSYKASSYKANTTSSGDPGTGYVGYYFAGGIECWGFAGFLGYQLSGHTNPYATWTKYSSISALDAAGGLKVGDILRTNTHSAMVYSISSDGTIKFAQCCGGEYNKIRVNEGYASGGTLRTNFDSIVNNCGFQFVIRSPEETNGTSIVTYENCTYNIIKNVTLRKEPFDSAEKGESLTANEDTVQSVALIDNGTNYWLKLTTGEYIFAGYNNEGTQTGNQYLEYVKDNSSCTSSSGWNMPTGNLELGKRFELKGDFSYSSSIASVEAEVYNTNSANSSNPIKESIGTTDNKKSRSFSIYTSTVNTGLPFTQLTAGDYRIDIKVNYYYNRGKIGSKVINSSTFSVGSSTATASTLQFSNVQYPKTFKIDTTYGWALGSGVVASNYELKTLSTKIVNSSGTAISSATVNISGYSYDIKELDTYSTSDNGVKFSKITSAGSYKWILTATDSSGRSLTLTMPVTAVASGSTTTSTASVTYTDNVAVTGVTVDLDEVTLREGEQTHITATVTPSNATNKAITWSSSNDSIATVASATSTSAKITAVKGGTATITCTTTDGSYKATCKITVTTSVTGISLSPSTLTLAWGETSTLSPTLAPSNATNQTVHWYTSDSAVVSVDNGVIKGISAGTATITAMAEDGGYQATCKVTVVVPVTSISLNYKALNLPIGKTRNAVATIVPTNATNKNVIWASSNSEVATINENGVLNTVGAGTATITCTAADGYGASASFTVSVVPVTGITLDYSSVTLQAGESFTLTPTISPSNASNKNVTWSSGKTAVATVSDGKVTAVSNGVASIYCSTEDGDYLAYCKVYVIDPVDLGSDFYALIRNVDSQKLVVAEGNATYSNVILSSETFREDQMWHFVRQDNGAYKIYHNEYLMELAGGKVEDKTNIRLYTDTGDSAQYWYIHKNGDGYRLTSRKAPGSCVDIAGGKSEDGTKIQLFTEHDNANQRFVIEICTLISSIDLDQSSIQFDTIGASETLSATVLPSNSTYNRVIWKTSDTSVATVSNGVVTSVGNGTATITCITPDGKHKAECEVAVSIAVETWHLEYDRTWLETAWGIANTSEIRCVYQPMDAMISNIKWTSSNPEVATVDEEGNITAVSGGTAVITCELTSNNWTGSQHIYISVFDEVFVLPKAMVEVEASAFQDVIALHLVEFPEGKISIQDSAFAENYNLAFAYFRGAEAEIADYAFENCHNLVFICSPGSDAQSYAETHGIEVLLTDE